VTTWEQLEHELAGELPVLGELETILWQANGRCVQLQQTRLSLGLSVVSNEYLQVEHALTRAEEQQLAEWGWEPPEAGDLNWHIEVPWPMTTGEGGQAAELLRRTMQLYSAASSPITFRLSGSQPMGQTHGDAGAKSRPGTSTRTPLVVATGVLLRGIWQRGTASAPSAAGR
jgi:T3SS (YopN, CesT) and YbjN peptide-binding chaperone 3